MVDSGWMANAGKSDDHIDASGTIPAEASAEQVVEYLRRAGVLAPQPLAPPPLDLPDGG